MNHLDLFSGIGGFALAAQQVWGVDYETIAFCDNDYFCQQVLKKNFPKVTVFGDIRTLTANSISTNGRRENNESSQNQRGIACKNRRESLQSEDWKAYSDNIKSSVDLITGGFPCQPFSQAGRKRGKEDNRYLWPEMLRVIKEFQPTWIIGENVAGIVNMVLNEVCLDLEAQGYEVQPIIIPAVALNAPHRRDRVWIIAYRTGKRLGDSIRQSVQRGNKRFGINDNRNKSWEQDWVKVATELCGLDDGLSKRLVRLSDGSTISYPRWRREALKAYGNAIVPQVAVEIMKVIKGVSTN